MEISDISTNSKSRIRFTTFGGRVAAGWYGGWERLGCPSPAAGGCVAGVVDPAGGALDAAAAISCRGVRAVCPRTVGVKVGNVRGRPGMGPGRRGISLIRPGTRQPAAGV